MAISLLAFFIFFPLEFFLISCLFVIYVSYHSLCVVFLFYILHVYFTSCKAAYCHCLTSAVTVSSNEK